ncbi:MAG: hypothetical protein ABDH18_00690 [Aquificaceae bacterium]
MAKSWMKIKWSLFSMHHCGVLFLKALLEELRIFGDYRGFTDKIKELLSIQTVDDLFEKIFERCEKDYGDFVKDVLVLLQVSRDGLSESELLEVLETSL